MGAELPSGHHLSQCPIRYRCGRLPAPSLFLLPFFTCRVFLLRCTRTRPWSCPHTGKLGYFSLQGELNALAHLPS